MKYEITVFSFFDAVQLKLCDKLTDDMSTIYIYETRQEPF